MPRKCLQRQFAFDSSDETLRDILIDEYLGRTAEWLLTGQANLHARIGNSHWEAALEIDFLLNLPPRIAQAPALRDRIRLATQDGLAWLASEHEVTCEGLSHWDGVTWDTAVVLRSILSAISAGSPIPGLERSAAFELASKSLAWLLKRFVEWPQEVKYPFGDSDIAQILTTALFVRLRFPHIYKRSLALLGRVLLSRFPNDPETQLCEFLISRRTMLGDREHTCFWEDFFQTAEVLESLTEYYVCASAEGWCDPGRLEEIRAVVFDTIHALELGQSKGMWGTHADTCRALYSYLRATHRLGIEPEVHIAFKALRWMCDEKQALNDGSFLHTSFVTVFFAHAILEACTSWPAANKRVLPMYDDVVWHMDASSSIERGLRLDLENKNRTLQMRISEVSRCASRRLRCLASVGLSIGLVVAALLSSSLGRAEIGDAGYIAIFVGVFVGLLVPIWTIGREGS